MIDGFLFLPVWPAIIAYTVFFLLLCFSLIYSKINWVLKSFITVGTILAVVLTYTTITSAFGWPTKNELPEFFQVLWAKSKEPSRDGKESGYILYWIVEVNIDPVTHEIKDPDYYPRVYELPFTKVEHDESIKITEQLIRGQKVYGKRRNKSVGQKIAEGAQSLTQGQSSEMTPGSSSGNYINSGNGLSSFETIQPEASLPGKQ